MSNLKINNLTAVQTNFMGNGAIYHGYAGMPDECGRVYTEEQCEIEANRAAKMKLKIARTMYRWWAWDKNTNTWDWDNEIMTAFYKWLQRMKEANITVALNTGWTNPGDVNSSSWMRESPFTVEGDWDKSVENYANWVSETVHQIVELRGFTNVKILVLFTEPQRADGILPEGKNTYETWFQSAKAAHDALIRDGRRHLVELMGPNEGHTTTSDMVKWAGEIPCDFIDIYSSHAYLNENYVPAHFAKNYSSNGNNTLNLNQPGMRSHYNVTLTPNTEYTFKMYYRFENQANAVLSRDVRFGAFKDVPFNDIFDDNLNKPVDELNEGSLLYLTYKDLSTEYSSMTITFNSKDSTSAKVGVFSDLINENGFGESLNSTNGAIIVDGFELIETKSGKVIDINGKFENIGAGWNVEHAGLIVADLDSYDCWYKWAKTGIGYVPKGKPYCFDEYNVVFNRDYSRIHHGAEIGTAMVAFMNAGVQSSLMWTLLDQQWPNDHTYNADSFVDGDHRMGVMPVLTRSLVPHRSYYAFGLISKYVESGSTIYEGFGENYLHTTMAVAPNGDVTVIVVNCKDTADDFEINFEKSIDLTLNRYAFDPNTLIPNEKAEMIKTDKTIPVNASLKDTIVPFGVNVYTTIKV
ncbi:MAG: hypothetical protein E7551_03260 [Ruminococcaceae bacterium]|nr:hypothetical protein [Oscillospiraceae bacterium]